MTAYVDDLMVHGGPGLYRGEDAVQAERVGARNGHRWAHLYCEDLEELHQFAASIGLRREWAQTSRRGVPHYDLTPGRRARAVVAGAIPLTRREAFELRARLRAASGGALFSGGTAAAAPVPPSVLSLPLSRTVASQPGAMPAGRDGADRPEAPGEIPSLSRHMGDAS